MENFEQEINDKIDGLFSFDDDLSSPINIADKGLGFHHKENALKESQFKVKDRSLKSSGHPLPSLSDIKEVPIPKTLAHSSLSSSSRTEKKPANSSTYTSMKTPEIEIKEPEEQVIYQPSSVEKVAMAWFVDFVLINALLGCAVFVIFSVSGLEISSFSNVLTQADFLIFSGFFYFLLYSLYFTALGLLGTPGRMLFGTKLVSTDDNNVLKPWQTLTRSSIILLSPLFILLPLYFGLHDEWSKTRSVEDKW